MTDFFESIRIIWETIFFVPVPILPNLTYGGLLLGFIGISFFFLFLKSLFKGD